MLNITEESINLVAPNQAAIINGRELVKKNRFVKLNISNDETIIFGECMGSGKSNYTTSVDFVNSEAPVYRCTCPSRQFPCKHALGLMYAYVGGKQFQTADIPQDIMEKRNKAVKKDENKKEKEKEKAAGKPKKVNKSALLKKISAQKEGLELLVKIINNITQSGLGTINSKTIQMLEDQTIQLGNYYIPGVQTALREFILLFKNNDDHEKIYTQAVDSLIRLYSLCKKGMEYLEQKLNDPEMPVDTTTDIEELLGHAWQLGELRDIGSVQNDVELAQLSFNSYTDEARREFVDTGIWINLKTGQLQETRNYRPFKAAKHMQEDDSVYSVVQVKELFVYPGNDMNPRIRWENMQTRELKEVDYRLIKSYAYKSLKEIVKLVKKQIKNPLSCKYPVALVQFVKIGMNGDKYVLEDSEGEKIVLADPCGFEPPSLNLLPLIIKENLHNQVLLMRFHNDMDAGRLYAKPLSIIKDDSLIRLVY
jgi:hypothetical protein